MEHNTTLKRQGTELLELDLEQELDIRDEKKYKLKAICNSKVNVKEVVSQLPRLYYLVFCENYAKKKKHL